MNRRTFLATITAAAMGAACTLYGVGTADAVITHPMVTTNGTDWRVGGEVGDWVHIYQPTSFWRWREFPYTDGFYKITEVTTTTMRVEG